MSDILCDLLDDYLDGELSDVDRRAFDHHLLVCEQCQTDVSLQQRLDSALSDYAETLAPANPVTPTRNTQWRPISTPLAACLAVAALLWIAWIASQDFEVTETHPELVSSPAFTPKAETPATHVLNDVVASQPRFRTIESDKYLAVIEQPADDELTVIMLYPRISESDDL